MIDVKFADFCETCAIDRGLRSTQVGAVMPPCDVQNVTDWVDLMRRYFFNVHNGNGLTEDHEGLALPNLEAAREQALLGIRSLVGEELETGTIDLSGRLDICDNSGSVLLSVRFDEAVKLRAPDKEEE